MSDVSLLDELTDLVTLIYHEARNVRHLVRAKAVEAVEWKYLIALPTNRDEAWVEMQVVRRSARLAATAAGVLSQFERRFSISLAGLERLFSHSAWRGSSRGGNAWLEIASLARKFADEIDRGLHEEAAATRKCIQAARHNTGTIASKLSRLDESLPPDAAI